ncbi:2Fe-2S iron-sulfur cluster binding domain protein [Ostertagia ostertagi]
MLAGRAFSSLMRSIKPKSVPMPLRSAYTSSSASSQETPTKQIMFICGNETFIGTGKVGEHLLDVVLNNDLPLEGFGECVRVVHVILSLKRNISIEFDRINPASQEELDLLDNAPELSEFSRLGCQASIFAMLSSRILSSLLRSYKFSPYLKSVSFLNTASSPSSVRSASTKQVEFVCGDEKFVGTAKLGDTILDVVVNNDLPLDGFGACEGTLACCTCHVVLSPEHFERVDRINPAGEEELDLLDLAPELSDHSRLGCQVQVEADDPDTIVVKVPVQKRDARTLE